MQIITLSGRVGGDAEVRQAGSNEVTSFNLAVDQGWGERKATNWFRVSIWGDRGRKLAGHILKGNKLVVSGELEIGEYNGKPQFNVRAHDCDPWMSKGETPRGEQQGLPRVEANPEFDDLDSVPF